MPAAAPHWRLLTGDGAAVTPEPVPAGGARNMAIDHALLDAVADGAPPVLRLYRWTPACLSFGRNQHAAGVYDQDRIRGAGIDIVRRPTGGLAVLHDVELTYTVVAPLHLFGGPRDAYRVINRAIVKGLRRLGVDAAVADEAHGSPYPAADAAMPCFQAPAPGEVVAAGGKLVGSAQRTERRTVLQHGSILVDGSQADVVRLLAATAVPLAVPAAGGITLRELLGTIPPWDRVAAAITRGFEDVAGTRLAPGTLNDREADRAAALECRYAAADWTWRH